MDASILFNNDNTSDDNNNMGIFNTATTEQQEMKDMQKQKQTNPTRDKDKRCFKGNNNIDPNHQKKDEPSKLAQVQIHLQVQK